MNEASQTNGVVVLCRLDLGKAGSNPSFALTRRNARRQYIKSDSTQQRPCLSFQDEKCRFGGCRIGKKRHISRIQMIFWLLIVAVFLAALLLTRLLRLYALSRSLMDVPNERSSHAVPTPRGGGLAIVLSFLAGGLALGGFGLTPWSEVAALGGAAAVVALIGFCDDHGHIPARWRLLVHFAAAAWALAWMGGAPVLPIAGGVLESGWLGALLAAVALVWLLNLYNFMDGIDGIAAAEAVCVCSGGAILYLLTGRPEAGYAPLLLAAAAAGFLCWNFPSAKIFMGDVGSGFLGITLGVLALQAGWTAPQLTWSWLILLGTFIVDATWTLLRRLARGERVYEAHRSHAYQRASRKAGSHLPITLAVIGINVLWLLPMAALVALGYLEGGVALVIAYAPLLALAIGFKAGVRD
ncbi:MraY family glycosyltransferase [Achromobacter xylosoxidans]